jgi:hypothetical protein
MKGVMAWPTFRSSLIIVSTSSLSQLVDSAQITDSHRNHIDH